MGPNVFALLIMMCFPSTQICVPQEERVYLSYARCMDELEPLRASALRAELAFGSDAPRSRASAGRKPG